MTQPRVPSQTIQVYFSDFFDIAPERLEEYGAFNISLINDLPLFIDPFLIFNSPKPEYQALHQGIIRYVRFLRDKASAGDIRLGLLEAWYYFGEVKQNWLGYSLVGNSGTGLGPNFAVALHRNLHTIFANFGDEQITRGSHLEKLCLISSGVGRDNISDFTTNLIKEYLVEYTQTFARRHLLRRHRRTFSVDKVRFNYETATWEQRLYELPHFQGNYVILTPRDMLTQDDLWINRDDLLDSYHDIAATISNEQLRAQINAYFLSILPDRASRTATKKAADGVLARYPEIIEYYIRNREDSGEEARTISDQKVHEAEEVFISQVSSLVETLNAQTDFYAETGDSLEAARRRVLFLKQVIENNDGYRLFYLNGAPLQRESDVQVLYRLTWFAAPYDVNREVNNGRGPVDFKISKGATDKSLVEFKLASNSQLKRNLERQVPIYEQANETGKSLKVIFFFTAQEHERVLRIIRELKLEASPNIILVDARADNKPSASTA